MGLSDPSRRPSCQYFISRDEVPFELGGAFSCFYARRQRLEDSEAAAC